MLPIGTVLPDSFIADFASFLNKEDLYKFSLIGPKVNTIVKTNRLVLKDFTDVTINMLDDTVDLNYYWSVRSYFTDYKHHTIKIPQHKLALSLSVIRSTDELNWISGEITDKEMDQLCYTKIREATFKDVVIDVNPVSFLKFLQRNPYCITLQKVELSNKLVSDQNIALLRECDIYCAQNAKYKNRVTQLTDDFLRGPAMRLEKRQPLILTGFLTEFTVERIAHFIEKAGSKERDLGIIKFDQLANAMAYQNNNTDKKLKLFNRNGLKMLIIEFVVREQDSDDDFGYSYQDGIVVFTVSLMDNVNGLETEVSIPDDIISVDTLTSLAKYSEVFYDPESYKLEESGQRFYRKLSFKLDERKATIFEVEYDPGFDSKMFDVCNLVKTEIVVPEIHKIILRFLEHKSFIVFFDIIGIELNDALYELLEPIAGDVTIGFSWNISDVRLTARNFLKLTNTQSGMFRAFEIKNKTKNVKLLTNEDLSVFLAEKFSLDLDGIEKDYVSPLTDNLLRSLVWKEDGFPTRFCVKYYETKFTADGIKTILEALNSKKDKQKPIHYLLGTIDEKNLDEICNLLEQIEKETVSIWNVTKESAGSRKKVAYSTVTIEHKEGAQMPFGLVTIEFDIPEGKSYDDCSDEYNSD